MSASTFCSEDIIWALRNKLNDFGQFGSPGPHQVPLQQNRTTFNNQISLRCCLANHDDSVIFLRSRTRRFQDRASGRRRRPRGPSLRGHVGHPVLHASARTRGHLGCAETAPNLVDLRRGSGARGATPWEQWLEPDSGPRDKSCERVVERFGRVQCLISGNAASFAGPL
jgi:hypothetical protein